MRPSQAQANHWRVPFFGLWMGQAISLVGSRVVQFALVWWLTRSTGSATVLATASMMALLPGAWFGVALVAIFVVGLSIPLIDGPLMAILQATVEPGLQGRVFMLIGSLVSMTSPVGLAIAGPVSDRLGLQVWYVTASLMCGLLALAGFFLPTLVHIEENGQEKGSATLAAWPAGPEL